MRPTEGVSQDKQASAKVTKLVTKEQKVTERYIIETNAEALAIVIPSHHKSLGQLGGIISNRSAAESTH